MPNRRTSRTPPTEPDFLRPPTPPDHTEFYEPDSAYREATNMVNNVFCTLYCHAIVLSPAPILSPSPIRPRHDLPREAAHELWNNCMYGMNTLIRALKSLHGVVGQLAPPTPAEYPDLGRISPIDPTPATLDQAWMSYFLYISRWARVYQAYWDRVVDKARPSTAFRSTVKDLLRALKSVEYDYPWMIETAESILKGSAPPPLPLPVDEIVPMTPVETPAGPEHARVRRGGAAPVIKKVRFEPMDPVVELRRGSANTALGIEVEPWHSPPKVPQWQQETSTDDSEDSGTSPQGPLSSASDSDDDVVYSVPDDIAVALTHPSPEGLPPAELLRVPLATRASSSTKILSKSPVIQSTGGMSVKAWDIPKIESLRSSVCHTATTSQTTSHCATPSAWTSELDDKTYSIYSPEEYTSPKWINDLPTPATTPRTLDSPKLHGWSALEQDSPPSLKYDTKPTRLPLRALSSCNCGPACRCSCPRDGDEDELMSPASDVSECGSDAPFAMSPPGTPRGMLYSSSAHGCSGSQLGWRGDRFVRSAADVFEY